MKVTSSCVRTTMQAGGDWRIHYLHKVVKREDPKRVCSNEHSDSAPAHKNTPSHVRVSSGGERLKRGGEEV